MFTELCIGKKPEKPPNRSRSGARHLSAVLYRICLIPSDGAVPAPDVSVFSCFSTKSVKAVESLSDQTFSRFFLLPTETGAFLWVSGPFFPGNEGTGYGVGEQKNIRNVLLYK